MLYTETDLEESMDKIETINFHEVREVAGIKFWCYHAGHVLGAAMFMIEIAGVKVQRNNKTTRPPPYSFCVFSPVLMRCFLSYTAAVHRRLLSTGGQTSDGSWDPQCQTWHLDHCTVSFLMKKLFFSVYSLHDQTQGESCCFVFCFYLGVNLRHTHPWKEGRTWSSVLQHSPWHCQ